MEALLRSLTENPQLKQFLDSGWKPDVPLCAGIPQQGNFWTGIDCWGYDTKPGVVRRINLPLNPNFGPLPPSWGDLLEPEEFLLENNFYTGVLPESWSKLRSLKKLQLHWQRQAWVEEKALGLTGQIPASWGNMVNLETLTLGGNAFTGTFPAAEFNAMRNMTYFSIDGNINLQGFLPETWKNRPLFQMVYAVDITVNDGEPVLRGPDNYGQGGSLPFATLYTGSGPLWRTKITNWEGAGNNSVSNPNPQPTPDPCKNSDPSRVCWCTGTTVCF